jgi:hypothetical protein
MAKLFGVRIDKIINKELSPGLLAGELYSKTEGTRDANNPTAGKTGGVSTTHKLRGLTNSYRDNEVDNELILHSDRKVLVVALSIKPFIEPETGMAVRMSDDDKTYRIISVRRDPASATYICQGRL